MEPPKPTLDPCCPHCGKPLLGTEIQKADSPGTAKFLATYINLDGEHMFFWADLPERRTVN